MTSAAATTGSTAETAAAKNDERTCNKIFLTLWAQRCQVIKKSVTDEILLINVHSSLTDLSILKRQLRRRWQLTINECFKL